MRTKAILILGAALALAGCGESRFTGLTGAGTGGIGGAGGSGGGGGTTCVDDTTAYACIGRTQTSTAVLNPSVTVLNTQTTVHVIVPVEYHDASDERAQSFEMWLERNGVKYYFHPNGSCPVVPDKPGVEGVRLVDMGTLSGLPSGQYTLWVRHGLNDPCYVPPANADLDAQNFTILDRGQLTVCN